MEITPKTTAHQLLEELIQAKRNWIIGRMEEVNAFARLDTAKGQVSAYRTLISSLQERLNAATTAATGLDEV